MYQNPELIFSRGRNQGANSIAEMVKLQMPKTLGGGSNAYGMTQKMCDAYYMANGDEFSREHFKEEYPSGTRFVTKEEVEAGTYPQLKEGVYKEYANREPRFYASVSYNGCVWALLKMQRQRTIRMTLRNKSTIITVSIRTVSPVLVFIYDLASVS